MRRPREPGLDEGSLRERLGGDLWALTGQLGAPVAAVTTLTASRHGPRATFRLTLADGGVVKGRRCEDEAQAVRVEALVEYLDPRHFPRVVQRHRAALLEEWIEGQPPLAADGLAGRGGAILAGVHATKLPEPLHAGAQSYAESSATRLAAGVEALVRRQALSASDGARTRELALARAPRRMACGLAHGDFCVENVILDARGEVHVVDNETVLVHPPEYDLARSWYRWPMQPAERLAYQRGYGRSRAREAFRSHFEFWAVLVLVEAVLFRMHVGAEHRIPLERLSALIRRSERAGRG